jgi:hypothetical protein
MSIIQFARAANLVCLLTALLVQPSSGVDLRNMSAADIRALQERLRDANCYAGPSDGQASAATEAALKACPSQDPVLRIETGMHVAILTQIGVDKACRVAATGSFDKTVRVWSLPDGQLVRTLRVPIGAGNGGKVFAAAISPEGRWIAAGSFCRASQAAASGSEGPSWEGRRRRHGPAHDKARIPAGANQEYAGNNGGTS